MQGKKSYLDDKSVLTKEKIKKTDINTLGTGEGLRNQRMVPNTLRKIPEKNTFSIKWKNASQKTIKSRFASPQRKRMREESV